MKYPITQLDFNVDYESFADLCRAIYGDKAVTDKALYTWLFQQNIYNPDGEHMLHVAKDGEKVVASDCLMPIPLIINGKKYLAAWSIKTMTHPEYQRQGIFRGMTEYNIAKAKEMGIDLILGFANANSFPGYKKFGWDILVERRAVVRPLDIKGTLLKRKLTAPFAGLGNSIYRMVDSRRISNLERAEYKAEILESAPFHTQAWEQMIKDFPVLVERDEDYITWRYSQRPRQDYKFAVARDDHGPVGVLIYRFNASNQSCILVDYVGPKHSSALSALLYQVITDCNVNNIRYIINSSGSAYDNYLVQKFGFKYLTAPMANNMFIACRLNPEISLEDLKTEANWFYSYGDSELDIDLQPR